MTDEATAKREAANAAFQAWRDRPKTPSRDDDAGNEAFKAEIDRLWLAMWEAADFSWDGLADAGWDLDYDERSEAQRLKRWWAPAEFPGSERVGADGEFADRKRTLQDYWRWSIGITAGAPRLLTDDELAAQGFLVERDGVLWHVLHRPETRAALEHSDGLERRGNDGPAEAARTSAPLGGAILARLSAARSAAQSQHQPTPVLLTGARAKGLGPVLQTLNGPNDAGDAHILYLSAPLAHLSGFRTSGLSFGSFTDFSNAHFGDRAGFSGTEFGDYADLSRAHFGDHAMFYKTRFGTRAKFNEASFGARTWWNQAEFGDHATFTDAVFGEATSFGQSSFADNASFSSVQFGPRLSFSKSVFGDQASFSGASFGDRANFESAKFGDKARFIGAKFANGANFREATFGDDVNFATATFGDDASFLGATFDGRLLMFGRRSSQQPTFSGLASFKLARFRGPAMFGDTSKKRGAAFAGKTNFRAATFLDYADFSECEWPENAEDQHGAFEGARFCAVADFSNARFSAFAILDGAVFERMVRFTDPYRIRSKRGWRAVWSRIVRLWRGVTLQPHPNSPDGVFKDAAKATKAAVRRDQSLQRAKDYSTAEDKNAHERGGEARWRTLASGFRTLKLAMEAQSDKDREQRFYRYELKARMRRPSTRWWEKRVSGLYGLTANYGASIARPFFSLAVMMVAFSALYWAVANAAGLPQGAALAPSAVTVQTTHAAQDTEWAANVWPALDFSMSQTFRPFGVWWGPGMPEIPAAPGRSEASLEDRLASAPWRVQLAHALGQGWWTAVKFVATVQSLLSVILLFLFALAVRRRFQIS